MKKPTATYYALACRHCETAQVTYATAKPSAQCDKCGRTCVVLQNRRLHDLHGMAKKRFGRGGRDTALRDAVLRAVGERSRERPPWKKPKPVGNTTPASTPRPRRGGSVRRRDPEADGLCEWGRCSGVQRKARSETVKNRRRALHRVRVDGQLLRVCETCLDFVRSKHRASRGGGPEKISTLLDDLLP